MTASWKAARDLTVDVAEVGELPLRDGQRQQDVKRVLQPPGEGLHDAAAGEAEEKKESGGTPDGGD